MCLCVCLCVCVRVRACMCACSVPLTTFQYMLEKLPKSWDRRTPPLEDAAKVEEVMVCSLQDVQPTAGVMISLYVSV